MSLKNEQLLPTDVSGNVRKSSVGYCGCYGVLQTDIQDVQFKGNFVPVHAMQIAGVGVTAPLILNFSTVQRCVARYTTSPRMQTQSVSIDLELAGPTTEQDWISCRTAAAGTETCIIKPGD